MKLDNIKSFRLINMYEKLNRGDIINKKKFAEEFGISEKSVQRDIDDLRTYLYESGGNETAIEYDYEKSGYRLVKQERTFLTNEEIFAVAKILLESRGLNKQELNSLIDKLLIQATPSARVNIKELILNERFHYIPPRHGKPIIDLIWKLNGHIFNKEIIEFDYIRKDGVASHRAVKPLSVMFSDYYFYLIAWMADDSKDFPTVFRVDRMTEVKATGEKFKIPYKDRFEEGEFRKRVQFMYSGPLKTIRFEYTGQSIEAILDRIPGAEILEQSNGKYVLKAECYGDGILMWLRTQGDYVKILN
ncbi:MAG: WYL domain-containing protein [Clostridiales bacterium]|nr:WYL domain-containing protein [Clostridiales bacterium]